MISQKTATPPDVRVMTFNFRYATAKDGDNRWENRKDFVADIIRDYAPGALGIQEAFRSQLDEVKARLPGYGEVGVGRNGGDNGEYTAILYDRNRFDLVQSGTFWLSETPNEPSRDWGSRCTRLCAWAQLTDKESKLSFFFYNTHLDHRSQEAREKGLQLIMKHAARRRQKAPLILTGDLNAGEDNPAIEFLTGKGASGKPEDVLVDSFRVVHPDEKAVGTYHAFNGNTNGSKIDYVFVSPDVQTLEATIVRTSRDGRYPSDHFPVTATIRFEKNRNQELGVRSWMIQR